MLDSESEEAATHGRYAIGVVAKLTGLSVHNLRVWEKRHGAVTVARTKTERRLYTQANLNRLLLLKRCVNAGHSISLIARLENSELLNLLANRAPLAASVDGGYPSRLFTASQLGRIAKLKRGAAYDECAQALSELSDLVLQLARFERQSAECCAHHPDDAALHHNLQYAAAQARLIMERTLTDLLRFEGVSPEMWRHE